MKGTDDDGVRLIACVCALLEQCSLLNWEKQMQVHSKHSFIASFIIFSIQIFVL